MKKYLLLLLLLLIPTFSNSQTDTIKIDYPYIKYVVNKIDSLKVDKLYNKTKNWIGQYYKNPDFVLKSEIINESIRIDGKNEFSFAFMGTQVYDYRYTLNIEFKDGRYKMEFSNIVMLKDTPLPDFFYKKGVRKNQSVNIKMCDGFIKSLNDINLSLYNYLNGKKKDW